MKHEGFFSAFVQYLKKVLLAEIIVLVITALVCWYIHWRTLAGYSDGLLLAGLGVMGFGVMGFFGSSSFNGNLRYQYAQSVMPGSLQDRMRQNMLQVHESMNFTVFSGVVGLFTMLIAFGIKLVS